MPSSIQLLSFAWSGGAILLMREIGFVNVVKTKKVSRRGSCFDLGKKRRVFFPKVETRVGKGTSDNTVSLFLPGIRSALSAAFRFHT